MARPNSFDTLSTYCLQQLGAPVIQVHVAAEQIQNRVEDAFDFMREFHGDAIERTYLKHQVTQDDIDNGYLPVGDGVTAVLNVFPITAGANSNSQFSASYQIKVNDIYSLQNSSGSLATGGLAYYEETKQYLNMMDDMFLGQQQFRFNAKIGKLHIDMDWSENVNVGDYILVECTVILDETVYTSIYNDRMLKKLAVAYIKKQWGSNMKLHGNIVLPGGITIQGQQIYDEAMEEIDKIEDQIRDTYQAPPMFLVG
jgi:hypothetical protein